MKSGSILVIVSLIFFSSGCVGLISPPGGVSGNGTGNFSLNLFGFPNLTTEATIACGINMTCNQSGTTINLDSLGTGGGDTINYYNYTNYTNGTTLNSSSCAANEVLRNYDNGTGWECVINDHSGFIISESDPVAMANISNNFANWNSTYNATYAGYAALISSLQLNDSWLFTNISRLDGINIIQNDSIALKLTASLLNSTVDKNLSNYSNVPGFVTNSTMAHDSTKINKTKDFFKYGFDIESQDYHTGNPLHTEDGDFGGIASLVAIDLNPGAWNLNAMSLSNGIKWNTSCDPSPYGYCWEYMKNNSPTRSAMAYQFINDVFSYYAWDANINSTKLSEQNETDHTQGYYKRMDFDNDLKIYYGNITVAKQAGTGNAIAQVDSTGKLFVNRTAGAGTPSRSPDGKYWCTFTSNTGTLSTLNATTNPC